MFQEIHQNHRDHFRHHVETRGADNISARLGSAWHASVLHKENIAIITDNFKVKEKVNYLRNLMVLLYLLLPG